MCYCLQPGVWGQTQQTNQNNQNNQTIKTKIQQQAHLGEGGHGEILGLSVLVLALLAVPHHTGF